MVDYILVVSTPIPEQRPQTSSSNITAYKYQRIHILNSLRERSVAMPTLHREAILLLPHLLDVSKHLAILTSAVVRNSKKPRTKGQRSQGNNTLEDFSRRCCDVEVKALESVAQLIRKQNTARRRTPVVQPHTQDHSCCQACGMHSPVGVDASKSSSSAELPDDFVEITSYPTSPTGEFVKDSFRDVVWQNNPRDGRVPNNRANDDISPIDRNPASNESGDETKRRKGLLAFLGKR